MSKKVGRPAAKPTSEKTTLSIRATGSLKERLLAAANKNDQSLSMEAESRIERSFDREGEKLLTLETLLSPRLAGIVSLLFFIMKFAVEEASLHSFQSHRRQPEFEEWGRANWLADPYSYDQMVQAAVAALEIFRPKGDPTHLANGSIIDKDSWRRSAGMAISYNLIRDLKRHENDHPQDALLPTMKFLRRELGPLIDRIELDPDVHSFITRVLGRNISTGPARPPDAKR